MLRDFRHIGDKSEFIFTSNQRLYLIITSILVVAFVLVFYAFPPYGSDSGSDKVVKITYADNMSDGQREVIELFNKEHKGSIEVVPIDLPFSKFSTNERKELLARYFRSKSDRIDVFAVDLIWVPRFTKWCLPLDKYIPEDQTKDLTQYAVHTCYFNDVLTAAPLYLDIATMYYRKDLIDALPDGEHWSKEISQSITWQDFLKLRKRMQIGSSPFFIFQGAPYEGLSCIYTELLANMNTEIIRHDSVQLETPGAEKSLQFLVDLVHRYGLSPENVTRFDEDEGFAYYLNHDGVFFHGWPGFLRKEQLKKEFPHSFSNTAIAPLPHLSGSQPAYVFGGWDLMISKFSTKVPEAVEFIRFLLSKESQELMYEVADLCRRTKPYIRILLSLPSIPS